MAMKQDVNYPLIVTIGLVGTILLVVLVIGAQAWFYYRQDLERARKNSEPAAALVTLRSEQQARLNSYAWIDREKGVVALPIDVAMDRVVQRHAERKPAR